MSALFAIVLIAGVSVVIFLSGNGITGLIAEEQTSDFQELKQKVSGNYWGCVYECRDNWDACTNDITQKMRREACGDIYAACVNRCRKISRYPFRTVR